MSEINVHELELLTPMRTKDGTAQGYAVAIDEPRRMVKLGSQGAKDTPWLELASVEVATDAEGANG